MYLLDANVLIDAARDYYPLDRVPEFWEWLLHHAAQGQVKIPLEIYEEAKDGDDALGMWLREKETRTRIVLAEEASPKLVSEVTSRGYAVDLTDDEIEKIGRDPFLIAAALAGPENRRVVTTESSKPSRSRANRHIPDVCSDLGIESLNTFAFLRELNFKTSWR